MSTSFPNVNAPSYRTAFLFAALLVAGVLIVLVSGRPAGGLAPRLGHAQQAEVLMEEQPLVVLAHRPVCSLLGPSKEAARITGQDTGGTVEVDGVVYWTFGDTTLAAGPWLPNTIASSPDKDAADCIDLTPKQEDGRAVEFLPVIREREIAVWPGGMEDTGPGRVNFYYTSIEANPAGGWQPAGVGIGSFDTATLTARRELDGDLLWTRGQPLPGRVLADEIYVYVLLNISRAPWTTDAILARVPKDAFESPAEYEYWYPAQDEEPGRWVGGLWDAAAGTWEPAISEIAPLWRQTGFHNGVEIAYNDFLGRWVAVYSADVMSSVRARTAEELTGPWEEAEETELIDCLDFHPREGFICYSGAQHEYYEKDGGRTLYISYANSSAYQVLLHEVRLATGISQWRDTEGNVAYVQSSEDGPAGFLQDGVAFYASDIPVPGFSAIRLWEHGQTGVMRYGVKSPDSTGEFLDLGVAFYAPTDAETAESTNVGYAPVYRWTGVDGSRYSPFNLADAGYEQEEIAFYSPCADADDDGLTDCAESLIGTDVYLVDTDGDGCSDSRELEENPGIGGLRDPLNPWDFFDAPDENNVRDNAITTQDIIRVVMRYGSEGDPSADPHSPIPAAPAYHPAFDRGDRVGAYPWSRGAADGAVGAPEIVVVVLQFGNNCGPLR